MKNTMKRSKKRGITFLETVVSIGIIGIFSLLIFPTLKITNKLEERFSIQEQIERNSGRVVEVLEKNIEESSFGESEYFGRDTLINGKGVFLLEGPKPSGLDERFFNNRCKRGNTLFLEIPYVKNEKIYSDYFVYRFFNNQFLVSRCSLLQGILYFDTEDVLLSDVKGDFEIDKYGIKIEMTIKKIEHSYIKELKGYALIGNRYE